MIQRSKTERPSHDDLRAIALRVRESVVRMAGRGGCFVGASLSCADVVTYLYTSVMDVAPDRVDDDDRDFFLLSKGHDVPALYGTLAELGYFPKARLENHLSPKDSLYWHPNRMIPGVEFHSGSLGHLLAVGVGVALDMKLCGTKNRVFVLLGDGECDEGSIWEALLVAKAHGLDNLVVIVDRNEFQANFRTEALIPLEPLDKKLEAFGCNVRACDGHDFAALEAAFTGLPENGAPSAIIAHTVRGKGLPSLEARADRWFVALEPTEVESMLLELHGQGAAELPGEPLLVR